MAFHKSFLCRYAAIKVVSIHDTKLAATFWGSLFLSFLFTIFCIIRFKSYQLIDDAVSTMSIKVKGTATLWDKEPMFFDATDLVQNIDSSTISITTSFYDAIRDQNGRHSSKQYTDDVKSIHIHDLNQWTIYWRQDLFFPAFNFKTSSALKYSNNDSLISLHEIIKGAQENHHLKEIAARGAIFKISCDWKCDLDRNHCHKSFRYRRLDHGEGFNYWTKMNETTVQKRYGIKLVFATDGVAGKFNWYRLFIAIGAALAYVSVIRLVTDMVLMYCVHEKIKYYNQKYDHLYKDDEGKWVLGKSQAVEDSDPPMAVI